MLCCSERMTAQECLNHPWISGELSICNSNECLSESPARRSFNCLSCSQCGAQCCQNDDHRHKQSSVVDIIHDRGILCWYTVKLVFKNRVFMWEETVLFLHSSSPLQYFCMMISNCYYLNKVFCCKWWLCCLYLLFEFSVSVFNSSC